jgi:hypothetical protein
LYGEQCLVKSELGEATATRGSKRKRFYFLTGAGKASLVRAKEIRDSVHRPCNVCPRHFVSCQKLGMNKYIPILLFVGLMIACHKSGGPTSTAAFPNEIGDQWVYKYSPSGNPAADTGTVQVDIVGQITLPDGEPAKIWVTNYSNDPNPSDDTTLVVDSGSTVIIYYNNICPDCTSKMPAERKRYNFPLQVSDEWIYSLNDTTRVLGEPGLQVPAGNFPNTFQLSKTVGYSVESFTKDTIFITPAVGITKYFQNEFDQGPLPGNGLWELASYRLK